MNFWIVQGLGIVSLIIFASSLQMKTKEKVLILNMSACACLIFQYFLRNAMTGVAAASFSIFRGIIFYIYKKRDLKPSLVVLVILELIIIALTILTWQDIFSLLPFLGLSCNLYGQWQNNLKRLRIFAIFGSVNFFIYQLNAGMYTAMFGEVAIVVSGIIALWRFRQQRIQENSEKKAAE